MEEAKNTKATGGRAPNIPQKTDFEQQFKDLVGGTNLSRLTDLKKQGALTKKV